MKRSNIITQVLPHICIILSVVLFGITVTDYCNVQMKFVDNDITKGMLMALCLCSLIASVILCGYQKYEQ